MAERFDAIVVGAGHNGLTAGTYLARAGKKVLVLERMATPGGLSQSSHVIPEAPDHMIHTATAEIIYMRTSPVLHELELVKHGWKTIDVDPSYAYLDPDGRSIAIFRDPRRTAEDIAQFSKSDAKAYLELIELTDALLEFAGAMGKGDPAVNSIGRYIDLARVAVRNRRLRSKLNLVTNAPADQLAAEWFEHPAVRAFALSMAGLAGPTDVDGNGIAYALLSMLHRIGVGKAVGGMQMVANCFASAYAAAGGELRVNAPVRHILIERGKMRGVELEDGTVIEAPVVISTQDPTTAARMIGEEALDRVTLARMQYSPSNRSNVGQSLLNVATREPVLLKRHQAMRSDGADLNKAVGMIGTFDQLKRALVESRRGQVPRDIVLTVSPMSNWDPSLAPPGQGYAYLYLSVFPVHVNEGWEKHKAPAADAIIARTSEYYSGLDAELGRWFETCPDRAVRVNITNGCASQVDFGSFRTGAKRPAFGLAGEGPIAPGFFLGGASVHPGAGVSGIAGRITAQRVEKYLARFR